MKVVEILKLGQIWLKLLQKSCIKIDDLQYLPMYDDYNRLVKKGYKKSYAILHLSEKYGVSERQVYYLLKKFSSDCTICADG